jgi:effector-binding domain-containing protein
LSERRTRELVREKLEQINTTTFSDDQMAIKDEYNKIKNEFLNQINFKYENLNKENKIKSYMNKINQTLNDIYYMNSTLETMINKLFQTTNMTDYIENMPNFAKIFRNKSINYYKAIYSDIAKYYKLIINISNEYPLYSDYIEDKFGELSGYAIIDGLNHLDPVCQNGNCPYKIDIKNLAIENSGRRLSEKKFKKVVKEIVNILGDMRDFIKNNHYIPKDNEPLSLRKLAGLKESSIYSTTSSFNIAKNIKYDSSKPGLDKKNVEAVLSPLRTTLDSYHDFIYKTAQRFSEDVENSIRDKLFNLENILEKKLEKY